MRNLVLMSLLLGIGVESLAQEGPSLAPESKKTVEAFAGKWAVEGTLAVPDLPQPAKIQFTLDCKATAAGAAVNCSADGQIVGLGPYQAGILVGFDPETKKVHFMAMTSGQEYHDHLGAWAADGKTLQFEPLAFTIQGKSALEEFSMSIPGDGSMEFKSVTKLMDQPIATFEGKAKRQ